LPFPFSFVFLKENKGTKDSRWLDEKMIYRAWKGKLRGKYKEKSTAIGCSL
jgi:hypothetical protein